MVRKTIVYADVGEAVRAVFDEHTPFKGERFGLAIVPGKKRPKGLGAEEGAWAKLLQKIVAQIKKTPDRPEYGVLEAEQGDARITLNQNLEKTIELYAERIREANQKPKPVAVADGGN